MSNQKMEPFESRLGGQYPMEKVANPDYSGPRAIVIPLPEDYEGPGLGEECEWFTQGSCQWWESGIDGVRYANGEVRFFIGNRWIPLDRIRHPQPRTVEIDGKHYPADKVQRALKCCGVEPVEET